MSKSSSDILEQADGCLWRAMERVRRAYDTADGCARADLRATLRSACSGGSGCGWSSSARPSG